MFCIFLKTKLASMYTVSYYFENIFFYIFNIPNWYIDVIFFLSQQPTKKWFPYI